MGHETCAACGFDGGTLDDAALLGDVRALGPRWRALLRGSGTELRIRPAPEVWSAIEYAAHTRDVTALHVFGVEQALTVDEPVLPEIEADELIEGAAVSYAGADPDEVAGAIDSEAIRLAQLADEAGTPGWTRGLTIGAHRMDVRALLEHALHDSTHHLDDVKKGLALLRAGSGSS
ncbi:MAG: DinB family protein [Acidimicrobiales bacterium]